MDYTSFPPPSRKLDLRTVLLVPLRQFASWLVIVLIVTLAGYPGVVCVTPMAWLIALPTGTQVAGRSRSALPSRRLTEAALAGGLLGLLQGVLFMVIVPFMGPIQSNELANTTGIVIIMLIAGVWIGAGLAFFTAYLSENRRGGW